MKKYKLLSGAVAIAGALVLAASAGAAQKTITVPATMDWRTAQPEPSGCTNYGIAVFPHREDAIGWQLTWKVGDRENAKALSPPFDDEAFVKYGWQPAEGTHWAQVTHNGRFSFGGNPVDCTDLMARLQPLISDVKVTITLREDAKIIGTIKDTDGDPVKGVTVRAPGAGSARTDADGEYEIDVPETTRTYTVTPRVAAGTFRPVRRKVAIRPGQTKRANFRMKAERQIVGQVQMECKGSRSCRLLPVMGVSVRAKGGGRSYTATTDERGRFKLAVKAGRYQVQTTNSVMTVAPKRTNVDVRRALKRTADFETCGLVGARTAKTNAVEAGTWHPRGACAADVQVKWTPPNTLGFKWEAAPKCQLGGNPQVVNTRKWLFGSKTHFQGINPAAGNHLVIDIPKVTFAFPGGTGPNPFLFSGQIFASGAGYVDGNVSVPIARGNFTGNCVYALDKQPMWQR